MSDEGEEAPERARHAGIVGGAFATAVRVESVGEEREWVARHYPGAVVVAQALVRHDDAPFDVLTVQLPSGELRDVHFEISAFFGRDSEPGPPCPYCGEPLAAADARQCRFCGTDWHDPEHVVRPRGDGGG